MRNLRRQPERMSAVLPLAGALLLSLVSTVSAHEGPPFPILMDKPAAGYVVSVWADPDIGEASFYVVLETPAGQLPAQEPHVLLWTQPISGRLDRVEYRGQRQNLRGRMQFEIKPEFDQRDMWKVGVQIKTAGSALGELTTEVESTPPGLGPWDFAVYLFPFVLLGGLWILGMLRRWRLQQAKSGEQDPPSGPTEQRFERAPVCRAVGVKK